MYLSLNPWLSSSGAPRRMTSVRAHFAEQWHADPENRESKRSEIESHVGALFPTQRQKEWEAKDTGEYSRKYREKQVEKAREFFGRADPTPVDVDEAMLSPKSKITSVLAMGGNFTDLDAESSFSSTEDNGLVYTMLEAYVNHRVLVLRPDDFTHHMCLVTALWMGSAENAEAVRTKFVDHDGKQQLSVAVETIEEFPTKFREAIDGALKRNGGLTETLTPAFTTTTPDDVQFANVALMCVFKHYFDYRMSVLCGLRGVRLLGTLQDWELLLEKYNALKKILPEMQHWYTKMDFVINLLVRTAKGEPGVKEDWNNMAQRSQTRDGYGHTHSLFDGWVLALDPFTVAGLPRDMEKQREHFTTTRASCEVEVCGISKEAVKARAYVSLAGFVYSSADDSVRPLAVWWLAGPVGLVNARWKRAAIEKLRKNGGSEEADEVQEIAEKLGEAIGSGAWVRWCVVPCIRCVLRMIVKWGPDP